MAKFHKKFKIMKQKALKINQKALFIYKSVQSKVVKAKNDTETTTNTHLTTTSLLC